MNIWVLMPSPHDAFKWLSITCLALGFLGWISRDLVPDSKPTGCATILVVLAFVFYLLMPEP